MYNKALDAFIAVADNGSFSKAANQLYITHTALIKQINSLEDHLDVKLFHRSNHGTSLSPAGVILYGEAIEIMKASDNAISRIQEAHFSSPKVLLIGTSTLYPCQVFMDIWDIIVKKHPQYQLKIVSFDNDAKRLNLLNDAFDFIVGPFNSQMKNNGYIFIPIGAYKFTLSMNRNHALSQHKSLSLKDLSDETIMIMKEGNSPINDQIRHIIKQQYTDITILDINPSYDVSTFNKCAESQHILLSLECWKEIHPSLKTIPLNEKFNLPYGIVTTNKPSDKMKEFIHILKETIEN